MSDNTKQEDIKLEKNELGKVVAEMLNNCIGDNTSNEIKISKSEYNNIMNALGVDEQTRKKVNDANNEIIASAMRVASERNLDVCKNLKTVGELHGNNTLTIKMATDNGSITVRNDAYRKYNINPNFNGKGDGSEADNESKVSFNVTKVSVKVSMNKQFRDISQQYYDVFKDLFGDIVDEDDISDDASTEKKDAA